jgi:antibiotic biosynthesis monooxygenase (ABM) superfamily enzyme
VNATETSQPVTVLATRTVRRGHELEFEEFLIHLRHVFAAAPGHLNLTIVQPRPPSREYALVYQFDSQASLLAWEASPGRAATIAYSTPLTESPPQERLLTGVETWFAAPTGGIVRPPPRWKMWLLSACGIYPIITLTTEAAGPLLMPLPPPARFAIVTPVLSALMTWAVMPLLSRLLAPFLYPTARRTLNPEPSATPDGTPRPRDPAIPSYKEKNADGKPG